MAEKNEESSKPLSEEEMKKKMEEELKQFADMDNLSEDELKEIEAAVQENKDQVTAAGPTTIVDVQPSIQAIPGQSNAVPSTSAAAAVPVNAEGQTVPGNPVSVPSSPIPAPVQLDANGQPIPAAPAAVQLDANGQPIPAAPAPEFKPEINEELAKKLEEEIAKKREAIGFKTVSREEFVNYLKSHQKAIVYHALWYMVFKVDDHKITKAGLYEALCEVTSKSAIEPIDQHKFYFGLGFILRLRLFDQYVVVFEKDKLKINVNVDNLKIILQEVGEPISDRPKIEESKKQEMFANFLKDDFVDLLGPRARNPKPPKTPKKVKEAKPDEEGKPVKPTKGSKESKSAKESKPGKEEKEGNSPKASKPKKSASEDDIGVSVSKSSVKKKKAN